MNTNPDRSDLWQKHPICNAAGPEACLELARKASTVRFPPNTVVAKQGDPTDQHYVILEGVVRLFHLLPNGLEITVKLLGSPNTFAATEFLHQIPLLINMATMDQVWIGLVPAGDYFEWLERYPPALMELAKNISGAFCVTAINERRAGAPLEQWVSSVLLSYAEYFGKPGPDGTIIEYSLSQESIAQSIGAARRTVSQIVEKWQKRGWLSKVGKTYVIRQRQPLEHIAGPLRHCLCYHIGMPLQRLACEPVESSPHVELLTGSGHQKGSKHTIDRELIIGTHRHCHLMISDDSISPNHCRIFRARSGGRYWVEDSESLNGTYLNEKKIKRAVLQNGDILQLGYTKLKFHL